ncbi:MAG: MoxR family ATPase [Deltaproteobacteria bacterium]|nr:MoxR family ATPase [Deltaproteobacteria bacterium]
MPLTEPSAPDPESTHGNGAASTTSEPPVSLPPESASLMSPPGSSADDDVALVALLQEKAKDLRAEIKKRIVGQDAVVELLLLALFARGHGLFVGVPGLAKTLLISTLAEGLGLSFNRIQFTPDLMPSDITGTDVLEEDKATGARTFRFLKGPVFANVLLADEINRTPPKTQAALLQAMQEQKVTAGGQTFTLQQPFLVFATQNPIEQEGTYPLPEAQLDRFMFLIEVGYPDEQDEMEIVRQTTGASSQKLRPVLSVDDVLRFQDLVRRVPVPDSVVAYAVKLARATRPGNSEGPGNLVAASKKLSWGAGPRASQSLVLAAKARAVLDGRFAASVADVAATATAVLGHRVVVSFQAQAQGVRAKDVIAEILKALPAGG